MQLLGGGVASGGGVRWNGGRRTGVGMGGSGGGLLQQNLNSSQARRSKFRIGL